MIASLFRKSTPFNYTLLIVVVVLFYAIYMVLGVHPTELSGWVSAIGIFLVHFASLFILNFIVKKNGISRDNSFAILFYFLFLLFFPGVLEDADLVISNFFILLSLRRLISLHSLKTPKEKIFDASLWIFVATMFHFWSILFMILVFVSILFHVSRDYRNWILPFIAAFTATTLFLMFSLWLRPARIDYLLDSIAVNFRIDYFTNSSQNLALSLFAPVVTFIFLTMIGGMSNRPVILQSSYKKVILAFVIALGIFFISPVKSNNLLLFTFAPLAIMAGTITEVFSEGWKREALATGVAALAITSFFLQL